MARKKESPKPMSELRHDFAASLENLCQQALNMLQAVDTLIKHDTVLSPSLKELLARRADALRDALMSEWD